MMRTNLQAAVAGVLAISASTGMAAHPMRFDCDTAAGSFSEIQQPQESNRFTVSGELSALELRYHERWAPVATLRVAARGDDPVFLRLRAADANAQTLDLVVFRGTADAEAEVLTSVGLKQAVPFTISVQPDAVRFTAAGKTVEFRRSFKATPEIRIMCSTGEFVFEKLQIK